jgi:iron complex outermembrane recepter protein
MTDGFLGGRRLPLAGMAAAILALLIVDVSPAAAEEDWTRRLRELEAGGTPSFDPGALQLAQEVQSIQFNIPSQPLSGALAAFGRQSGWQLSYPADLAGGLRSQAVSGARTPDAALTELLAGTGVIWRPVGERTAVLERPAQSGDITLDPVQVVDQQLSETAWGPVDGYVAKQSATGSKTDTPLIETPRSVSVITAEQIQEQQVTDIRAALRYSAGVVAEARGADFSQPSLIIRGFQNYDPIYQDGMKGHGRSFLTYASTPVDPYGLERVEVLRGPASVLYGQGQPGGLVNAVTKRPTEDFFAEIEGDAGTFDTFGGKFDVGGAVDSEKELLFRFTAAGRQGDNQVDTLRDSRVYAAPAFTWQPSEDTTLTLLADYQRDDTNGAQIVPADALDGPDIDTDTLLSEPGYEKYDTRRISAGYIFDHRFDDTWQVHHKLRYTDFSVDYRGLISAGFQADGRTLNRTAFETDEEGYYLSTDSNVQAGFDLGFMKHTLLLGVDYKLASADIVGAFGGASDIDAFDPDYGGSIGPLTVFQDSVEDTDQVGLYIQDQIKFFDKLVLTLGGRQDWAGSKIHNRIGDNSEQDDDDFTWQAGVVYLFDNGLAPYFSYAESFEPQSGVDINGQPFVPTTGDQFEVGIKYQPTGYDSFITLSAYQLTRQNILTPDPVNDLFSVQTGEARSRGIEVEVKASLADNLDLTGAYTFTDTEITKSNAGDEGNRLDSVPHHAASLWADYTLDSGMFDGLGLGAGVRYIGPTTDTSNTVTVDDVTLVDAAIHYEWNSFRFALNASNLFDETYISSCFSPTFCYFGQRRTVLGSVSYRW